MALDFTIQPLAGFLEGVGALPGLLADSIAKMIELKQDIKAEFGVSSLEALSRDLANLEFTPSGLRRSVRDFFDNPTIASKEKIRADIRKNAPMIRRFEKVVAKNEYAWARVYKAMGPIRDVTQAKSRFYALIGNEDGLNRYLTTSNAREDASSLRQIGDKLERLFDQANEKIKAAQELLEAHIRERDKL